MEIQMPYGPGFLSIEVPAQNIIGFLEPPPSLPSLPDVDVVIKNALACPVGARPLGQLVHPGMKVSIAISDASRPNIEKWILPVVFAELSKAGIKDEDITVIVGTGSHRPATPGEIASMVGSKVDSIKVINHFSDTSPLVDLGRTPGGYPALVNRYFYEADLKIALGTILPHPIAGYSGGGKAIAVGLSSSETISSIHTPATLDDPHTGLGKVEGNPFIQFGYDVARLAGLDLLINAVVNEKEEIIDVICGEVEAAHQTLIERTARKIYEARFATPADIVIVAAGHPKDNNLYHVAAEALGVVAGNGVQYPCVKKGGTIIVVSPMAEGIYNETMFKYLSKAAPAEVVRELKTAKIDRPGMHRAYATAQILCDHEIIFAETQLDPEITRQVHIKPMATVAAALEYALAKHGAGASILVVKNSHRLVPILAASSLIKI
ncbi:Lactate racemase [Neomoorella glycerini]|uniref:Lactate racemase n=1 Tax=Neomoorella glycerini TaxID=55779 RepID=A0A6I5ZS37_9FIRM|nr:nickel-dependent lactate racemase [Moorella glycerini]QGP92415.1 Lactate racemase [Moorella glycerini]